jgi:formylglycine-generating enzyme required for sulfatase activity
MCLAGELLGNAAVNLKTLQAPLPNKDGQDEKKPQSWKHGALLPVRVILRDFAASGLLAPGEPGRAKHVWDFIGRDLEEGGIEGWAEPLKKELLERGGLLLLDGLDEVPEADSRRGQIKQAIQDLAATCENCRILVTSRTYAYQKQDWKLPGFAEAVLAPFSPGQIRQFVARWYVHTAKLRGANRDDAQGRAVLLQRAIFASERLLTLAERPLLLTLMASLHAWRGGDLPEKREQLYADATELLLEIWQKAKTVRGKDGGITVEQPGFIEWLKADRGKMRDLLNRLAFEAHGKQPDLTGTADIAEQDLVGGMLKLRDDADIKPKELINYLSQRAGLLIPHGNAVYTFPHRTFQEYLAACHLAKKDYPRLVAELARREPDRWREVALLAGARASQGTPFALWALADELLAGPITDGRDWGALIAGQLVAESASLGDPSAAEQAKLELVRQRQVEIMRQGKLPALERAVAGRTLGRIGDPRREVTTLEAMQFSLVSAGEFWLGEKEDAEIYVLDYDYWIARFPITVAQFSAFVKDSGYKPSDEDSLKDPSNYPVRKVTWHEMRAFCDWLTGEWQKEKLLPKGWEIKLPSEVEWEKAARGGLRIPGQPVVKPIVELASFSASPPLVDNPREKSRYPWGDEIDAERANYGETGIGRTSAVGCFPGGKSPYGAEEMSGNLWEWTRSVYEKYPYDSKDGREELESKGLRVLRGGSWSNPPEGLRASFRAPYGPDDSGGGLGFRVAACLARTP